MSRNGLPLGWTTAPLGEIADVQLGKMLDRKRTEGTSLRYLRNINVRWGHIDISDLLEMPFRDHELDRYAVKSGDVMVCEGGEPGRAAVWTRDDLDIKYQKALHRVRVGGGLLPTWLVHQLQLDASSGQLSRQFTGTTIGHLPLEAILDYEVRLAPLPEQRRIVEAVESYFTRLDGAAAILERAQRNLKRYRASVLKAAVEGRLVPTEAELARAEGRDYEPASVLLERILAERRRHWQQAGGRGKYEEPVVPDNSELPELPEGWWWATADALIWDAGYGTSQKCTYETNGPPVLRIPNVQNQAISLGDMKFATQGDDLKPDGVVEPGDFLFIRTNGSRDLIGRGSVIVERLPCPHHFASYLIRLRIVNVGAVPRWTGLAWHTPVLRRQILDGAASSAGQYNVSLSAARAFAVPLPPGAEQHRILSEVERTTSLIHACEEIVAANEGRCARLRQAILKWAFEGKLADQAPRDEPASVLLERIRTERVARSGSAPNAALPKRRGRNETTTGAKSGGSDRSG